jgi:SAM-dependent methyltransferase
MVHYNKCPLCSSENIGLRLKTADHFLSKENFNLFRCTDCGFVFTQDHPDEAGIGRYYESDEYLSHNEAKTGLFSSIYRISRKIMLGRKVRIVNKLSGFKNGSILDIGSGSGHFLSAMKEAGWEVKGIEINDKVRNSSISKFGLDVLDPGQLQTLHSGSFDCITLWHVLEHFQYPFRFAQEIHRLLKPGGSCIIALPNCSSYDAEHYGNFWAAYDVPRHLWHFTPDTFKRFSEQSGFKIPDIRRLPPDVFYISILSEKYRGANLPLITGMIKGFWFLLLSLFNKHRSSSLIYSIRKPIIN